MYTYIVQRINKFNSLDTINTHFWDKVLLKQVWYLYSNI